MNKPVFGLLTQAMLSLSPVAAERGSAASRLGLGVSQPRAGPASSLLRPEVSAKTLGVALTPPFPLACTIGHHAWPVLLLQELKYFPPPSPPLWLLAHVISHLEH